MSESAILSNPRPQARQKFWSIEVLVPQFGQYMVRQIIPPLFEALLPREASNDERDGQPNTEHQNDEVNDP